MLTLGNLQCLGFLGWIVLGGLAGWIASRITHTAERQGCLLDIAVGVVGAVLGGFLFSLLGLGMTGFIGSLFVAVIGAVVLLVVLKAISGRR